VGGAVVNQRNLGLAVRERQADAVISHSLAKKKAPGHVAVEKDD